MKQTTDHGEMTGDRKLGGQFYTPQCVVKLLVEMVEPYKGRVFDPCCGSGGMFASAVKFVQDRHSPAALQSQ